MKIVAWIFLILLVGTPFLLALWWLFPIVAGASVWLLYKFSNSKRVAPFIKPICYGLLAIFVIWLIIIPRGHLTPRPYEQSQAVRAFKPLLQPRPILSQSSQMERIQSLISEIGIQRVKLAEISDALKLLSNADGVRVKLDLAGENNEGMGSALTELRKELSPHKSDDGLTTTDLLKGENLRSLVEQTRKALDELQATIRSDDDLKKIEEEEYKLRTLSSQYRTEALYDAVSKVENSLHQALHVNVAPKASYSFEYDRESNTLISEQAIDLDLAGQRAVEIDATGLTPTNADPRIKQVILVHQGSGSEEEVKAPEYRLPLSDKTERLLIVCRSIQSSASRPLVTDKFWVPFEAVDLHWPIPLSSSFVLKLRFKQQPSLLWPITVSVVTDRADAIRKILVPKHSFYYSNAALRSTLAPESDSEQEELVPGSSAPTVAELSMARPMRIEILPRYLSNPLGQKWKAYLGFENLLSALIGAFVTSLLLAIVSRHKARARL
jgi:hypothetical protein